jgi:hypothetical protein
VDIEQYNEEMKRTAFQKKAVAFLSADEVLDLAVGYFKERGYRSARTGRPNQVFVMGGSEGGVPRVNAEISARADVGKPGTTLVTVDGFGERLGPALADFVAHLRALSKARRAARPAT